MLRRANWSVTASCSGVFRNQHLQLCGWLLERAASRHPAIRHDPCLLPPQHLERRFLRRSRVLPRAWQTRPHHWLLVL